MDFELPPPRPKRKPGTAAAAASASAGPTASMPMGLLQPGFAHVHASGAPHTLFPSLLSHTPGPVYPTAAMSTGTTSNTVPLNMMVPAPDTAGAASAFSAPPLTGQSSLLPSPTKQPGATAAATAAAPAVAAASTIPRAVQHAAAAGVAGLPVGDPTDPTSDAVLNKIAAAAVAAASTVAHAVIAAAGPQYVHVIQQLAHHDDRLRFLTCPISELMSSVATTTAIAPPHTASLSPSVHGAKDAADAPHVGSTEPGSSGIGSNSACRTAQLAATRLASAQPAAAPVHPSPSGALAAPAADGAWPGLAFRPPTGGASPSSLPFMNQMMGLPASNDALPSIHTSDLLAAPDAMLPSLGLSGSLPDSALGPAARNKSRSLGTKVGDAGGSEAADARGERGPSSDRPLFCSVPLNSGAMAQAAMHAQQLQTEGSQGYGEQGSGGDGSRDRTSADGGAAHGISAGNGSGGSAQPRSGGSGSKSGKQSGNRPAPAGGTTAPASPSPFQLPEVRGPRLRSSTVSMGNFCSELCKATPCDKRQYRSVVSSDPVGPPQTETHADLIPLPVQGMKPKGANAEESSRFYQQYYAEMIRRGTEGLRSIQQSMPQKAHALPDLGSLPGVPPSGAAAASPAGKVQPAPCGCLQNNFAVRLFLQHTTLCAGAWLVAHAGAPSCSPQKRTLLAAGASARRHLPRRHDRRGISDSASAQTAMTPARRAALPLTAASVRGCAFGCCYLGAVTC